MYHNKLKKYHSKRTESSKKTKQSIIGNQESIIALFCFQVQIIFIGSNIQMSRKTQWRQIQTSNMYKEKKSMYRKHGDGTTK